MSECRDIATLAISGGRSPEPMFKHIPNSNVHRIEAELPPRETARLCARHTAMPVTGADKAYVVLAQNDSAITWFFDVEAAKLI